MAETVSGRSHCASHAVAKLDARSSHSPQPFGVDDAVGSGAPTLSPPPFAPSGFAIVDSSSSPCSYGLDDAVGNGARTLSPLPFAPG